ncbi:MAG: (deoxy)nucleoside triphosphate pyrophosphohydrolase [Myxococcota bacterium]
MTGAAGRPRLVVVGAFAVREGRVLLTQRRADQAFGLLWELPGGKIEPGESPEEALSRELREELGVDAEILAIYDVLFHRYPEFDVLLLIYRCRLEGEPTALLVRDLGWFEPRRLAELAVLPADAPLVQRCLREGV